MVVLGASVASRLLRRCSSAGSWAQGVGPGRARLDVARYYCATPPPPPRSAHEVEAHIRQLLHERVAPHVRADGGDVHFEGFEAESGVLRVSLSGAEECRARRAGGGRRRLSGEGGGGRTVSWEGGTGRGPSPKEWEVGPGGRRGVGRTLSQWGHGKITPSERWWEVELPDWVGDRDDKTE
eukprot:scaffold230785_cov30-Tisochrysis_lutea.AAC.1